jgi:hypothetical protein
MLVWELIIIYMTWAIEIGVGGFGLPGPLVFAGALFAPIWLVWGFAYGMAWLFSGLLKEMWNA